MHKVHNKLYLRVSPKGKRTWVLRDRALYGDKWTKLGEYPAMSQQDAVQLVNSYVRPPPKDASAALWLSEKEIAALAVPIKKEAAIYFLVAKGKIVYVGCSRHVSRRIHEHLANKVEFDRYTVIPCKGPDMLKTEAAYIRRFKPPMNKLVPPC